MANMLIRTRRYKCYKEASILRVILFLGIPSFYLLFLSDNTGQEHFDVAPGKCVGSVASSCEMKFVFLIFCGIQVMSLLCHVNCSESSSEPSRTALTQPFWNSLRTACLDIKGNM